MSLTNVGVFAGAFTFGTLLSLSNTLENFDYISDLLSVAFLLFGTSLFVAIGIQYLLRRNDPTMPLTPRMRKICKTQTILIVALIITGFTMLDIVLINIGKKTVGIAGIILLYLIPLWYVIVSYGEKTGILHHVPRGNIEGPEVQVQPNSKGNV
jgi:hypothetical protein